MFKNQFNFLLQQHIRERIVFDALLKRGTRLSNRCFVFCYMPTSLDYPRLGMIIAKRHCALAVHRHRIKRQIRERFRLNQHALFGTDLVVLLRSSVKNVEEHEQNECLENLFLKLATLQCESASR